MGASARLAGALALLWLAAACLPGVQMSSAMRAVGDGAPEPQASASDSVVVFLRPTEPFACCQASVFELQDAASDVLVGIVAPNTKVAYRTRPGKHFFMVVGENASFLRAYLAAGRTYYVRIDSYEGQQKTRFDLKPLRRADLASSEFRALDEADLIENTSESFAWAEEHRDEIQQRKADRLRIWIDTHDDAEAALRPDDGI